MGFFLKKKNNDQMIYEYIFTRKKSIKELSL